MLYYNIILPGEGAGTGAAVTHHHHQPGHVHPSPQVAPSLLRLSAAQRLAAVAVVVALLWGAVIWAMA